jgi:hypothetical protein
MVGLFCLFWYGIIRNYVRVFMFAFIFCRWNGQFVSIMVAKSEKMESLNA